jgi:hypothetical protein
MDQRANSSSFESLVDILSGLGILCFSADELMPLTEDMLFEAVQSLSPVTELSVLSIHLPESEYIHKHSLTTNIKEGTVNANVNSA